jgi:multicomponent K+:H+ antiporter subunit A
MSQFPFLLAALLLPFAGSLIAALLPTDARNLESWLAGIVALSVLGMTFYLFPTIAGGTVVRQEISWLPEYGLNFILRMDGLSAVFVLMISGIGFLVVIYARYYMSADDPVPRFFSYLLAFKGAMLGIVLSGNLIQLVFFWELTSIFSFLLIGYWHHNASARDGARMALTITATGGLCLLAGVLLIGHMAGSYDIDRVLAAEDTFRDHPLYVVMLVLVLIGAFTKSAQFPFHVWLPQAMAAPTPVSAYLHSAAMVKAGVFLLLRLWPALGGTHEWLWLVSSVGLTTFIVGAFFAIFQQDLKGLLAYSTISHLGLITLLIGLDRPLALVAAIFHIMNHATFKASLFMAAGIIDHETGTRDLRKLSGLWRYMPFTATLAIIAAASMAGIPLLNGFLSKEMFFAETIEYHDGSAIDDALPYIVTVASAFSVAYSVRFIREVFFGPPPVDLPRTPHEPPRWMRFPIEFLVGLCLLVGILPVLTIGPLLDVAAAAVLGPATPPYSLAVWHGFNLPLLMSTIAMIGGITLYFALRDYLHTAESGPWLLRRLDAQRIFERLLVTLSWRWARALERVLATRRLQPQLAIVVLLAVAAGALPIYGAGLAIPEVSLRNFDFIFAGIWSIAIVCAIGAAYLAKFHRLAALILIGVVGLATCLSFVWLSAPDLAITQLLVEIVTTVLLLLGLRWLPKRWEASEPGRQGAMAGARRVRDFTIAVVAGGGLGLVAYAAMSRPLVDSISSFFVERAYSAGGGTNVVNVILVDFRAFDTLGEITVLGVVALTVYALLRRFRPAADSIEVSEQKGRDDDDIRDVIRVPGMLIQLLFPLIAMVAIFLLLRGHDLPGGGFAAGITLAAALILQYMARGIRFVETRLRILPVVWISVGLLVAAVTGLASAPFSMPFLTSYVGYLNVPTIGDVPTMSAVLFDFGVFALVLGATALILVALAHQSIRSHRAAATEDR